jgi:transcriptional regulator with XRE-family HTH domain
MVNTEEFIKRLEIILEYYNLNASAFADKINVQRSSLSHLLSGRNKPSLDFILKITDVFPEVDLYWILNGKGTFPKNNEDKETPFEEIKNQILPTSSVESLIPETLFSERKNSTHTNPVISSKEETTVAGSVSDEIEKVVFFYKDGTFKVYQNK